MKVLSKEDFDLMRAQYGKQIMYALRDLKLVAIDDGGYIKDELNQLNVNLEADVKYFITKNIELEKKNEETERSLESWKTTADTWKNLHDELITEIAEANDKINQLQKDKNDIGNVNKVQANTIGALQFDLAENKDALANARSENDKLVIDNAVLRKNYNTIIDSRDVWRKTAQEYAQKLRSLGGEPHEVSMDVRHGS